MARQTVARFIARISFFERKKTDIVASTRDAVDVARTILVEWDFAHAIVAKSRLTVSTLKTLRTDWQRLDHLTNGSPQDGVSFVTTAISIGAFIVVGATDHRWEWL